MEGRLRFQKLSFGPKLVWRRAGVR